MSPGVECLPEELLTRFLERLVAPSEVETISQHLESCETCRKTLAFLADEDAVGGEPLVPANVDDVLVEGDQLGPYRFGRRLGAGAMGEVFLAVDTRLGRSVAMKHVRRKHQSSAAHRLLLEEARGLARLNHPNIVTIFDVNVTGDHVWLAMEFVDGLTLGQWVAQRPSISQVVAVFRQVAEGLAAAHARGVVHRDVKPANVLVGSDGRVRVSDFGLAAVDGVSLALGGTPAYMSPEQREGQETTAASDQYSLSVVMAEALTGQRPPPGVRPVWPTGVPTEVRSTVERGLALDPRMRFASMQAWGQALGLSPATSTSRRRRFSLMVVASAAAMVLGGVVWRQQVAATPGVATTVEHVLPSVVIVVAASADEKLSYAAGVLVPRGPKGYVLTSERLVKNASKVGVLQWQRDRLLYAAGEGGVKRFLFEHQRDFVGARVVRSDVAANLALLDLVGDFSQAEAPRFEGTSANVGEAVLVVGHPSGLLWTYAEGRIAATFETTLAAEFAQSDGLIGGAVVNRQGVILGMVTNGTEVARANSLRQLLEGATASYVTDRSTPERAVMSCLRAVELGQADAFVDCIDVESHWRTHEGVFAWMQVHATPAESFTIRKMLEQWATGDYTSKEHAVAELRATYRQMFSHDAPEVKATDGLVANLVGGSYSFPSDVIEQLRSGTRVERVEQVTPALAWVLIERPGSDGVVERESLVAVKCGDVWCMRQVPFPEEEALRPPSFPPGASWEASVAESGEKTLAVWRAYFAQHADGW